MFLSGNDRTQSMYTEAFKWIAESNNISAISNLTNDFVELGKQYKKYNFDKMAINMINQLISTQSKAENENKEEILIILKTGLANLME